MTSTTTTKTSTAVAAAVEGVSEAEAKHAAAVAELPAIAERVRKADAELKRIEQCIADDDPSAGLEDLTKADTELRFHKLTEQAKKKALVKSSAKVRLARTAAILARMEAGEYDIQMNRLRPEAEALATKIAALVAEHVRQCEANNVGRVQLLEDAKESDATNQQGTGNAESRLSWGHEDGKKHKPVWIEVNGEQVPVIHLGGRQEAILGRAEWIVKFGEESAAEYKSIY